MYLREHVLMYVGELYEETKFLLDEKMLAMRYVRRKKNELKVNKSLYNAAATHKH